MTEDALAYHAYTQRRFVIGMVLNSIFVVVELYYGFKANSIALIADAIHKASDVLGLGLIWFSYYISQIQASHKFTYGFKNSTIFAAFLNSIILIFAIGNLMWESMQRLAEPQPVVSLIVIWVAAFGVLINGLTAWLFLKDKDRDLNILSTFLNMALDTLLSFAVVIGGVFIWWKGWFFIDPALGIVIGVTIIYSIWKLFRESLNLVLQAVPANIDLHAVISDIEAVPEVISYHDLHIWPLSTTETALSVHVITSDENFSPQVTSTLIELLRDKHNIHHATIQLEVGLAETACLCC